MVTIRTGDHTETLTWDQWEQRVRAGRIPAHTLVRFEPVTGEDFVRADTLESWVAIQDDPERRWSTQYRQADPPWMVALIAGVVIRYWWLVTTGGLRDLVEWTVLSPAAILEDGEVWRLWSMGISHVTFLHMAGNLGMLVYVGWYLERAYGRWNLATIFVASVFVGGLASMAASPSGLSLGASGGVLGVVAAATVLGFFRMSVLPNRARTILGVALLPYLVLVYSLGWFGATTDNWAHTGGLVTGALLGLVLDPPPIERRRGWNLGLTLTAWFTMVATAGFLFLAGTWVIPTRQVEAPDAVAWSHPVTWKRLDHTWFESRADAERTWSVQLRTLEERVDPRAEVDRWVTAESEEDPAGTHAATEPTPTTLAGVPAVHARRVSASGVVEERWVAGRGRYRLQATWSVREEDEARLATLRDRLVSEVRWGLPGALESAKQAAERDPSSRRAAKLYADELIRWGDTEEASRILRELAAKTPEAPEGWLGLLAAMQENPTSIEDPSALWDAALRATDHPDVVSEVAISLSQRGRLDEALGLLELAWVRNPGDRAVRRARRLLGLSVDLSMQAPTHLLIDPWTGGPLDVPRRAPVDGPWTRAQASPIGAEIRAERERLATAVIAAPVPEGIGALILLKRGVPPKLPDLADEAKSVVEDLRSFRLGQEPRWVPDALRPWIAALSEQDLEVMRAASAPAASDVDEDDPAAADAEARWLANLGLAQVQGRRSERLQRRL